MSDTCLHVLSPERRDPPEPAELCDDDTAEGTDFCGHHLPLYDPDTRDAMNEDT